MDKTAADPMIGRVLDGRYRVGPRIARGGMAMVYEATDERLDRVCAVKIMHHGMGDDDDFVRRFVREARSAARLSHPHVVSVFDQGEDDGTVFLVMEYLPGHTLRDLIRKEAPMRPEKALRLMEPILSALGAAHQAGLIHRDVKPENVLLADDGRIKVADFGLARAISADTHHTATGGVLIGTVSYLAPELVVDGTADARSDVYSAGVLLYEMLTGRKPHEGDSPIQVAYKHVHEDVPPPSAVVPALPSYVDALVARATARERDQRPADARVLQQLTRRVKATVEAGILDDPELTADLSPRPSFADTTSIDYLTEADGERTTVLGAVVAAPPADERDSAAPPARRAASAPVPPRSDAPDPRRDTAGPPYRRSRRGPVLLALVVTLAVLAAAAGWYYGIGRYTTTPGIVNLPVAQAQAEVEAAGLAFEVVDEKHSETVTKGSVISTDPAAGDQILKDGTVEATVSLGPERFAVPVLKGLTVDEATDALEKENLTVGRVTEAYNDRIGEGVVLRSRPGPRTLLARDTAVALVVSRGPRPIEVPDVTGDPVDKARSALTDLNLEVTVTEEYSEEVAEGRVISQSPRSGDTLYKGDTVELVVSQGPPLVEVPRVVGSGVDVAKERLKAAGFKVRTVRSDTYIGLRYVLSQDPGAGEMLPKGSTVTISLV